MKRELSGGMSKTVRIIAILFGLAYFYISGFGLKWKATELIRGLYLLFNFVLGFLMYAPAKKLVKSKIIRFFDIGLAGLSCATIGYWIFAYSDYSLHRVGHLNSLDIFFGVCMILLSIELCRRAMGPLLASLGVIFLLICYFGPYLPGMFAHKGFSIVRIIEFLYSTMEGLFGSITSTFALYVMPFMVFGSVLQFSGAGEFFVQLSKALCGKLEGGAAIIAIWCCCLFGMISGSPVACAMSVGAFCIPMMIKAGYSKEMSAAITASAATGGQFMPPVMGAGAFLLSTLTETPYSRIIVLALAPALLYYLSLSFQVYFSARRDGLKGVPEEERTKLSDVLKTGWYYIFVLVGCTVSIVLGFSVSKMAFFATLFLIACSYLRKETRMTPKRFLDSMEDAGKGSVVVGATTGVLGLIMGGISLSGLGVKFSAAILQISGGNLFFCVVLTAAIALVLGMGVPTTASYIVMAILAAPSLITLGLEPVIAHLLCFWLCMTANVTPPVCVAAFSAASVAKAAPMKTGWKACVISIFLFLMPFCFAYSPQITLLGHSFLSIVEILVSWSCVLIALAGALQGWFFRRLSVIERIVMALLTAALMIPNLLFDIVGLISLGLLALYLRKTKDKYNQITA